MSKILYCSDDFYSHSEIEYTGSYGELEKMVNNYGLSEEDIYFNNDYRDEDVEDISKNILNYVNSKYPDAIALALVGSQSSWRGVFNGGSIMCIDEDIKEEIFCRSEWDDTTVRSEEDGEVIIHYSNHDWSCYMSLEVILKEHLSKQLVEDIESEIFDQEEVMTHLINNPRSNPIYVPYEGFVGQL